MCIHRSFMHHLLKEDSDHMKHFNSGIIGKEIYPVAYNPLNVHIDVKNDCKHRYRKDIYLNLFNNDKKKYMIIRGDKID